MDISINFLFQPGTKIKNISAKIFNLFEKCYLENIGKKLINISDPGTDRTVGLKQKYPIYSIDINENEFKPFHKIIYYSEFLKLLEKLSIQYDELYVNDESTGTFFNVYPAKNEDRLDEYEMSGVGYFHLIKKSTFNERYIEDIKKTNKYIIF